MKKQKIISVLLAITSMAFGQINFTENVNGVSFEMIAVEGGTFQMGFDNGNSNERPIHRVTLNNFTIGMTEVTQALWQEIMGYNPSSYIGLYVPVENVSWNDIQGFFTALNSKTGKTYRLPTEAEWEYAARGGNKSKGYEFAGSNTFADVTWNTYNVRRPRHVAGKQSNELGIYDMTGNVSEWCSDWYGAYTDSSQTNPKGALSGSNRVYRGSSWVAAANMWRVTNRDSRNPSYPDNSIGFRVILVP